MLLLMVMGLVQVAVAQVLGFFIYNFVTNFVLEPTYQTCFNSTLQRLKQDPRITVRLGNDIIGELRNTWVAVGVQLCVRFCGREEWVTAASGGWRVPSCG